MPRPAILPLVYASLCLIPQSGHAVPVVQPTIHRSFAHDTEAFTQGLLIYDGRIFESTGLYGASSLREVDPNDGTVLRSVALPEDEFGEGLARVDDRLIQLTWKAGIAHVWGLENFRSLGQQRYEGEGWGLCYDGQRLVMSDGTATLRFRDPQSFAELGKVRVTVDGESQGRLNELACVDGHIYANVWKRSDILRIDPSNGRCTHIIDADDLLDPLEALSADVLNGIAHDPDTGHFFVTGKLWPKVFEISFELPDVDPGTSGEEEDGGEAETATAEGSDGNQPGDIGINSAACHSSSNNAEHRWLFGLLGL